MGPPITLGNMRANGVRRIDAHCWNCYHNAALDVDHWPDEVTVVSFRPRLVCTSCGIIGADARPTWSDCPLVLPL